MSNENIGNLVRFVHFNGTVNDWELAKPGYANAVVFAQVLDLDQRVKKFIYAGKDVKGLDYQYFIQENAAAAIVVDNYAAAVAYTQSTSASEGQTVTVRNNTQVTVSGVTYSDNTAGNYIIVRDAQNFLTLIRLDNRWQYGNSGDGWHTGDEKTTATVGGIAAGTTLKDLIAQTNGGDLSRIIEKMLFMPAGVGVEIVAEPNPAIGGGNPHREIKVVFKVSKDAIEYKVYYGLSLTTLDKTLDETFLETMATKTEEGNQNLYTFVLDDEDFIPGQTYHFKGFGKNEVTQESRTTSATLQAYVLPVAAWNQTVQLVPWPDSNKLKMAVNSSDFIVTYNEYKKDGEPRFVLEGNEMTMAEIQNASLAYNHGWTLWGHQDCVVADGTSSEKYDASNYISRTMDSAAPKVSIVTIDGQPYDPTQEYVLYTNRVEIGCKVAAGIYSSELTAKVNDISCYTDTIYGTTLYNKTIDVSNLSASEGFQTIKLVNADEYKNADVTFTFKYEVENPLYINVIDRDKVEDEGFEIDVPSTMFEFEGAAEELYFLDCVGETDADIKDGSTYVDPNTGDTYYLFHSVNRYQNNGTYVCIIPETRNISLWSTTSGSGPAGVIPDTEMPLTATTYNFTYNDIAGYKAFYYNTYIYINDARYVYLKIN